MSQKSRMQGGGRGAGEDMGHNRRPQGLNSPRMEDMMDIDSYLYCDECEHDCYQVVRVPRPDNPGVCSHQVIDMNGKEYFGPPLCPDCHLGLSRIEAKHG